MKLRKLISKLQGFSYDKSIRVFDKDLQEYLNITDIVCPPERGAQVVLIVEHK